MSFINKTWKKMRGAAETHIDEDNKGQHAIRHMDLIYAAIARWEADPGSPRAKENSMQEVRGLAHTWHDAWH